MSPVGSPALMSAETFMHERDNSLSMLPILARDWNRRLPQDKQIQVPEQASIAEIREILAYIRAALDSTSLPPEANEDDRCKEALRSLLKDAFDRRQLKLLASSIDVQYSEEDSDDRVIANIVSGVWRCFQEEDPSPDICMNLFSVLNRDTYPPIVPIEGELSLKNWHCREVGGGPFEERLGKLGELFTAAYLRHH